MGVLGTVMDVLAVDESASGGGVLSGNGAQPATQVNAQQAAQMQDAAQNGTRNTFAQNFYRGMATRDPVVQYASDGKNVDWGGTLSRAGGRYVQRNLLDGIALEDEKQKLAKMFAASK